MQDLRTEMVLTLESLGIRVEAHHHEVATAGQAEIDMRFTTLTRMADNLMLYKYVIKNVARKHDMTATFMPKPLFEDNPSGMHVHQSLWKGQHEPVLQRGALRWLERAWAQLHRRPVETRVGVVRPLRADDELLPAIGSRLRSAHQLGLFATQPLRLLPDTHVLAEHTCKAGRVPNARIHPATATWPSPRC